MLGTVKPVLSSYSKRKPKIGFQDRLSLNEGQKYYRMLQGEHSAIFSPFIKLPFVLRPLFYLLKARFTVIKSVINVNLLFVETI